MKLIVSLVAALLALATPFSLNAQPINLSDGKYASSTDYLVGTWKWERAEPRETVLMTFGRDGNFFFHNLTTGLQHFGRYTIAGGNFHVTIGRSCNNAGASCSNRAPPLVVDDPFTPQTANVFTSNSERWERMRGK